MKKICICGHFAGDTETTSGQIIKTRIVATELISKFGEDQIFKIDSNGGVQSIPRVIVESFLAFFKCKNIIMMPAYKGLIFFTPLYSLLNLFFHRKIHYIVIGGWLNEFLEDHKWLCRMLKKFDDIYVETLSMKIALRDKGFKNIQVMPNFKMLEIVSSTDYEYNYKKPLKLCTFSRVMREKGIEDAIAAVIEINNKEKRTVYELDIFGQVDKRYQERFTKIMTECPSYICYKGVVPFNKSVQVLKKYFALLFPTFYAGEGFAGTLIDAMGAGVPVIASDWKFNSEIVVEGKTGTLVQKCDKEKLKRKLEELKDNPKDWIALRCTTVEAFKKYTPEVAIKCLTDQLE